MKWTVNISDHNRLEKKMPFIKGIFFWLLILTVGGLSAQNDFISDIRLSLNENPTLDFRIDSRHSFITARVARIVGIKVGANFDHRVKIGLGYNMLWNDISQNRIISNSRDEVETVNANFHLSYISPYFEYSFYTQERWDISILALLGIGRSHFSYTDQFGKEYKTDPSTFVLWEPYMTAEYKLWKYFGVGAGVGYSLAFSQNAFTRRNLTSPIYVFKFKLYFNELFKDLKERR